MNKLVALLVISSLWFMSCGKPHDPESIISPDISGGYSIVSKFTTPGTAQDVIKKDTLIFIAQGEGGLMIVNYANPNSPQTVSITTDNVRGYSTRIAMKDSAVYLAAGSFGVTVLDISNPYFPSVSFSNYGTKPARGLHIMGDFLLTATSELGVQISDISFPTQPDNLGRVTTIGYSYGSANTADSAYLLVACGEMGLSVIDISDIGGGLYPLVGWCDTPGNAEAVAVSDVGSIAFLACGNSGLQIVDFSDTTNIHIVGSFYHSGYAKALVYKDQKIFLAARKGGLQVIDVADVTMPKLIGKVDSEGAYGLDVHKRDQWYDVYIADEEEGLLVITSEMPVGK
ncbi:MAG: hypothetical protein IH598_01330 [Bacteroidales bacterium]|nr:hypothetical protein [Bacteroidales bacterium]